MKHILSCLSLLMLYALANAADTESTSPAKVIFPNIEKANHYPPGLTTIAKYAVENDWPLLPDNHLRIVTQPLGIVGAGYLVDLQTGRFQSYPGHHTKWQMREYQMTPEDFAEFKAVIDSEDFRNTPSQTDRWGLDGSSIFVEYQTDGEYSWICHWCTDSESVKQLAELMNKLDDKYQSLERRDKERTLNKRKED